MVWTMGVECGRGGFVLFLVLFCLVLRSFPLILACFSFCFYWLLCFSVVAFFPRGACSTSCVRACVCAMYSSLHEGLSATLVVRVKCVCVCLRWKRSCISLVLPHPSPSPHSHCIWSDRQYSGGHCRPPPYKICIRSGLFPSSYFGTSVCSTCNVGIGRRLKS